jgi:receptor protein-tyrosine kinase
VSIVEQATRRLEQLRRSGVEVHADVGPAGVVPPPLPVRPDGVPARLARLLDEKGPRPGDVAREPGPPVSREALPPQAPAPSGRESRQVEIDLAQLAAMGYLTPETPRTRIADEFRVIKRPLLANVNTHSAPLPARSNLIMVTSSLAGEGKTFVSINLAISLAMELDKTVLLVDADVSRPSVLTRLGLPASAGLLDVLTDPEVEVADVLVRTNIDKLSILPSGKANGRATELLASGAMNNLLNQMAIRYADRIVVFDAPPLLPSTESRALATHMGQVIVVVEADRTPQKLLNQALAMIESCPIVLPLLNKISRSEVGSYYGYYGPT